MNRREHQGPAPKVHRGTFWWLSSPPKPLEMAIHFAVIIIGLLELAHDRPIKLGLLDVVKPLVVLVILFSWWVCYRIFTARVPSTITTTAAIHKYSPKKRNLAAAILVLIPVGFVATYVVDLFPSKDFVILVAEFEGPEPQMYRVTELLLQELREVAKHEHNLHIEALSDTITEQQGSEQAVRVGKRRHAGMVLWGWYAKSEDSAVVTAHIELLRTSQVVGLKQATETLINSAGELSGFTTQIKIAQDLRSVTFLILGAQKFQTGNFSDAISDLSSALAGNGYSNQIAKSETVYLLRGMAYHLKGELDDALQDYNRALGIQSDLVLALNGRCVIFMARAEWGQALNDCNRAIEIGQPCCQFAAYANRGQLRRLLGQNSLAIEDYNRVIALRPTLAIAYSLRGTAYSDTHENQQALNDYDMAIKLDPNYALAFNNRGLVYLDLKNYDRAIMDFNKALKLFSSYKQAYNNRAVAYLRKGDTERAIADLRHAIEIDLNYLDAHLNLSKAYLIGSQPGPAAAELRLAFTLTHDPDKKREIEQFIRKVESGNYIIQE